jgi:aminoglycoside 2''-phosphotransferase
VFTFIIVKKLGKSSSYPGEQIRKIKGVFYTCKIHIRSGETNGSAMPIEAQYLQRIRAAFPALELKNMELNADGMTNLVVIVNRQRVFRFARGSSREDFDYEGPMLDLVRPYLKTPIPCFDFHSPDMVSYPYLPGRPLSQDLLLAMSETDQEHIARGLAEDFHSLHTIPLEKARAAGIRPCEVSRDAAGWKKLHAEIHQLVYPFMLEYARQWAERLFAVIEKKEFLKHTPAVVNSDVGPGHILFDPQSNELTGLLDWGTTSLGDPAVDYVGMLYEYGEAFLHRMAAYDRSIPAMLDRIRAWALTMDMQFLLWYQKTKDPAWLTTGLGSKRDIQPPGTKWD